AEGDLARASAILAPLRPAADLSPTLETQVYKAISELRQAPIIPRLKEILANPDPAFCYLNGELRFWLGWAQQVARDHAPAQESWRQARSELESFLQTQPENFQLIEDLALTNMCLGDKATSLAFSEKALATVPIEKDAVNGPSAIETLARVAAQIGEPDRAVVAWLLIQISTQVFPFFEIPNWAVRLIVLAIVIRFPIALVIAWAFELTPQGLKRTEDVDVAAQGSRKSHAWIYIVIVGAAFSIGLIFIGRYSARNTAN